MIEGLLIKAGVAVGLLSAVFIFGYFKGKSSEQHKQLKKGVDDALKTQKRRSKRSTDSSADVRKRMRKYVRKS